MKSNNKLLILIASFLILSLTLLANLLVIYAGTTGKISGKVIDAKTNEPLPGANIIIEGTTYGAAADKEGDYFVINLSPGIYTVKASMMGYEIYKKTDVRVHTDKTTIVNFSLNPTVIEGREVVVTAERPVVEMDIANTSTILSGDEIKSLPVLQFKDLLSRQMGTEVLDSRGLIIRGGREHEISLNLDGMETRDGIDNMVYTRVNPDAVQEVQILTGGFSAQYGNARAGVVNIQTKEGSDDYTFTLDLRTSIPDIKHFGKPWYERDREIYLSENAITDSIYSSSRVVWNNSQKDPITGQYGAYETLKPELLFEGWQARSLSIDPNDPIYGKFYNRPYLCRELYKWRTRESVVKYGDKPDVNANVTFGGPVPFLRNTYFFSSGRFERNHYLIRAQQDYFQDWGNSLKISSQITSNLKLVLTGNYMETSGVNRTDREIGVEGLGETDPSKDDQRNVIETPEAFAWFIYHRLDQPNELWPYSEFSVSHRIRRQLGLNMTHTLSKNTFWDLSLYYTNYRILGWYDNQKRDLNRIVTLTDPADPYYSVTLTGPYAYAPQGYYRDETLWSNVEDITGVRIAGSYHNLEKSRSTNIHLRANITSQIDKYNQINCGLEFNYTDISKDEYRNYDIPDRHWWKWHVFPKEAALYLQNKLEFKGLIASFGLRADISIPNHKWYDIDNNPYQPWFSRTWVTIGEGRDNRHVDIYRADSLGIEPTFTSPKKQIVLSPRLAVSHPISENAKIFFNYGHYNQLPDPEKRYYFLRRENFGAGLYRLGNPNMDYEKTVQYEVGYAQSLFDVFNIQITGYYRDITNLARQYTLNGYIDTVHVNQPIDTVYNYTSPSYVSWSNSGSEDIRGLEFRFEKRIGQFFTGWINGTYEVYSAGRYGNQTVYEDPTRDPIISTGVLAKPSARPKYNVNLNFHTPTDFGPKLSGIYPIGGINLNLLFWWKSQRKDDYNYMRGLNPYYQNFQNVQWKPHQAVDLRFEKRFDRLSKFATPVFYIQILNVFNQKNMNCAALDANQLTNYLNSLKLDKGDRPGDYPHDGKKSYIRLPDPEPFYLFLNPRQIFFGFRLEI